MRKTKIFKIIRFLPIFVLMIGWIFSGWPRIWQNPPIPPEIQKAQAAWGVPKIGSLVIDDGTVGSITLTEPAGIAEGDLMIACIGYRGSNAFTLPSGWALVATQQSLGDVDATNGIASGVMAYIVRGASAPDLTFVRTALALATAQGRIIAYSGGSTTPYDTGSANTLAVRALDVTTASITTAEANELIVAMVSVGDTDTTTAFLATDPTTASGVTNTITAPTAGTWIERSDDTTTTGGDNGLAIADAIRGTAGITGTIQATVVDDSRNVMIAGAFKIFPPTTTLGDGTDPGVNPTVAPGSKTNYLDQFTFSTDSGTDSITTLTVSTLNTSAIAAVGIYNEAMTTQYFGTTTVPTGNNWSLSAGTPIPVTTSLSYYRIVFDAKIHADLTAGTYAITGTTTDFTSGSGKAKAGTDTDSDTVTIDNSPPASATATSGSAGNAQVTLSWTTSASSDFSRSVVLRWAAATPGAEVPAEGTDYSVDQTITTATVACVRTADTTSTAVSGTDGAGTGGCSAVALTNGQAYSYKVFQKDSNGNYDAGVTFTGSPFTPAAASITLIVDTDQFPALTPETPRFATSTVSVNTNNTTGWYVTLERSDADTTMDLDTDATVNIIDKTEWIAGASTSTESSQPATTITSGQDFLAFRAMTASSTNGSMFFASTWWGSDDTPFTNAKWAGIASSTAATNLKKIGISSVSSGGSPALNTVQYYLDVPITQKTGAYSGTVIFTAVMN